MGTLNDVLCDYFSIPKYNADFWNGTVFRDSEPILPEHLERYDKEYYKHRRTKRKTKQLRRDILMLYNNCFTFLLGMEILATIDYTIAVRIMDYDVQELKRQLRDISTNNRKEAQHKKHFWNHSGEFLTGIKKKDRICPIYTIALYCGTEKYDGSANILGLLDTKNLSKHHKKLLKSYPIQIYILKDLDENNFTTSLREIVAIIKRSDDENSMLDYYLTHKERFQNMDDISIDAMGVLIGRTDLKLFRDEGGELNMCKAFENVFNKGHMEGHKEGLKEGVESCLVQSIKNIMQNLKLTAEQAMDALSIPMEERKYYKSIL